MHIRRTLAAAIVAVVATGLVVAVASGAGSDDKKVEVKAKLKGSNEVPPADPNGRGKAELKLKLKKGKVCFNVQFEGIGNAIAAHIHKGKAGVNGPIKVLLFETASSPVDRCVKGKKKILKKVAKHPERWYVNVHTGEFPLGAIRGQLKLAGGGHHSGGGGGTGGGGGGGTGGGGGGSPYPR
jgi:uncharacterized membrane protein YgcG